jgi:hypothetical protein
MNSKPTQTEATKTEPEYSLAACAPGDVSDTEFSFCVEIVRDGGAVAISMEKLQKARMLALARKGGVIVGVGSIKRDRPDRAANIAHRSGFSFPKETPELGFRCVSCGFPVKSHLRRPSPETPYSHSFRFWDNEARHAPREASPASSELRVQG